MKTPEEYLQRLYITKDGEPESIHDSVENVLDIFKQIQKDAWNEALDKAAENAEVEIVENEELYVESLPGYDRVEDMVILPIYGVDSNSILKLKIK